jgi:hypothetical protein
MALDNGNTEAICWAEKATQPAARQRAAFKWTEDGKRVPSTDPRTGVQLIERLPLQAHRGNNLTGVSVATDIKSTMKVLRHEGIWADVKTNNGPAHATDGSDRYELNMRAKARHFGWIPLGECPAAMVAHGLIEAHTVLAPEARDGKPCERHSLGIRNPHCRHLWAEMKARAAANGQKQSEREEAFKSEESRLMASNAQNTATMAQTTTTLLVEQQATQARMVEVLAALAASNGNGKPEKAGK